MRGGDSGEFGYLFCDAVGVIAPLTALVLGIATPQGALAQTSDSSALATVASACAGATTAAGDTHSRLESMYCGINIVRRNHGLAPVRGSGPLNRSTVLKADAVRRCGFSHTPCGMSFSWTYRRAGSVRISPGARASWARRFEHSPPGSTPRRIARTSSRQNGGTLASPSSAATSLAGAEAPSG